MPPIKGQLQKSLCPQTFIHNITNQTKKIHFCSTIKHETPIVQVSWKVELQYFGGTKLILKTCQFLSFQVRSSPPNSQMNHPPNHKNPTLPRAFPPIHQHIFGGWIQLTPIKERDECQSKGTHWQWTRRWPVIHFGVTLTWRLKQLIHTTY